MPAFLGQVDAQAIFTALRKRTDWQRECIGFFGRRVLAPRLTAWEGDAGSSYRYSGTEHVCSGWSAELEGVRRRVSTAVGWPFDFVLLNRYEAGSSYMGWHADDEPILGEAPVIASLSFGATRRFALRRRVDGHRLEIALEGGSLLLMFGTSQRLWKHSLPRTGCKVGERVNLTFRRLLMTPACG